MRLPAFFIANVYFLLLGGVPDKKMHVTIASVYFITNVYFLMGGVPHKDMLMAFCQHLFHSWSLIS